MFQGSPDDYLLSQEDLRARLAAVKAATPKALEALKDTPNLKVRDIAAFLGLKKHNVYVPEAPRILQKELSWFFHLWDSGELVKVKTHGNKRYTLVRRYQALAQVAPAPRAAGKTHRLQIDMTPEGLKLRMKVNGHGH